MLLITACTTQEATRVEKSSLVRIDTVKAGAFDTGKMWTFDFPPTDYLNKTYGINPTKEWFEKARLAALRLPGCSASFVSEDGLVMTNHHCALGALDNANRDGENLHETGFYAPALEDERMIKGLYVDQLVLMEDVTAEVVAAFDSGTTDEERIANRNKKVSEIEARYKEKTGLTCNVITFYNGGKYSVYGYKRYGDVRLVFAPESQLGFFGGDPDNFTYPRYALDVSFFRVYDEEGKPLKTSNYYKWNAEGAQEGEVVFVVGNPGRTNRLFTYSQLEFNRDVSFPYTLNMLNEQVDILSRYIEKYPDKKLQYQTRLFGMSNSQKLYIGRVKGLHDPILMAKKVDFEKTFTSEVLKNPALTKTYAPIWKEIADLQMQKGKLFGEQTTYSFRGLGRSTIVTLAADIVDYANAAKLPDDQRLPRFKGAMLDSAKARLSRIVIDKELESQILHTQLKYLQSIFGTSNTAFNKLMNGLPAADATRALVASSSLTDNAALASLLSKSGDDILKSGDPFIGFILATEGRAKVVREQYADIQSKEQARVQRLGKAIFDIYGTSIPPDATFTLRLADGIIRGYNYNGTTAPAFTTFYGLYDRFYSFDKKDPWSIPSRWIHAPTDFNMTTRFNFVSTNDIIGGNSGSPVVNKNLEVVGIAFDGNIESLPNDFIHTDIGHRAVSVHSAGILEALDKIYRAERIVRELKEGKQ